MNLSQILILGIVQGLTEFLPVSSTAHLILLPRFLNFPDPGLVFDISLHLGTLLAILLYFRREWVLITMAGIEVVRQQFIHRNNGALRSGAALACGTKNTPFRSSLGGTPPRAPIVAWLSKIVDRHPSIIDLLIVATLPGLFFGVLFASWAETIFRSPRLIAGTLAVFGIILWLVDKKVNQLSNLSNLKRREAFFIGLWQALALIPGVSRSGAAITGGLLVGLKREEAVKFSFLLSAPIIAGSAAAALFKVSSIKYQVLSTELILGVLTSFVSGFLAIKFLLGFVQKHSFLPFVIYRLILAVLILIFLV